jgi:hypothetical protein
MGRNREGNRIEMVTEDLRDYYIMECGKDNYTKGLFLSLYYLIFYRLGQQGEKGC